MKIMNKLNAMFLVLLLIAVPVSAQSTDYLDIDTVRINGDTANDGDNLFVERGDTMNIRVTVEAGSTDVENAQIQAFIAGYRYAHYERDLVTDYTRTFDLPAGTRRSFDLTVQVPVDMDKKDAKLRIVVADENSPNLITYNYQLSIYGTSEENAIQIRDFLVSPSSSVEAGRALNFRIRVENVGNDDLDDVTARVSIPALGIQTFETIDSLRQDQTQSFEALLLRLPIDARPGDYEVVTTVTFDRFESVEQRRTITVLPSTSAVEESDAASIITVPQTVSLTIGNGDVVYPVLIENKASRARTYVLSTSDVSDWGRASFDPASIVVIPGGSSETVYLRLSAKDSAEAGDNVFQIRVESGDEVRTVNAVAKLSGETQSDVGVRTILEWSLVVLIVLLIILGLILVFTRVRGRRDDDSDEETQTYY